MKFRLLFAWYDCWVGFFVDRARRRLYIFPIPMIGLVIQFHLPRDCRRCGSTVAVARGVCDSCWSKQVVQDITGVKP